jgi:hypothetical protein
MHTGYNFEHFQLSTGARKRAVLDMTVEIAHGVDAPTRTLTLQPGIAFKPMASMFVQLSPTIQRDEDAAQYVRTIPDATDVAFFGNRYVFAYIKTRTISLDTRVNWTFSPNLTLQLFVLPCIASQLLPHRNSVRADAQSRTRRQNRVRIYSFALLGGSLTVPGPLRTKKSPSSTASMPFHLRNTGSGLL